MLRLFNNSYPLTILLIFLMSLALWVPAVVMPHPPLHDGTALYFWLTGWMSPRLQAVINAILAAVGAVLAAVIYDRERLTGQLSYLPGLVFALTAGMCPVYYASSAIVPAMFTVLLSMHYLLGYKQNDHSASRIFYASFFIGVAALIYFPLAGLCVSVLLAHLYFRRPNLRHLIIALTGHLLPWTYCVAIWFLFCEHASWVQLPGLAMPDGWAFTSFSFSPPAWVQLGSILLIGIISFPSFVRQINQSTLLNRRSLLLVFWTGCLLAILLLNRVDAMLLQALALAPTAAIYFCTFVINSKRRTAGDILLWAMLLISIADQYLLLHLGY